MFLRNTRSLGAILLAAAVLVAQQAMASSQGGPPYSPQDTIGTFKIADGFRIELFASEPLISSPVAMDVDERGRMFVVEMPGYPLDVSGSGRVKRLEDTDADGKPDRATIFADGLRLPTGIMRWKQGVLVTDSPQVWYLEDADDDGRAEIKREMLTGFALTNPQHTTNAPVYGLDNWIYLANEGPVRTVRYRDIFGDAGGDVRFPDKPDGPRLPPDAGGRNVRFRPDTHQLEMLSGRSQFGQTFDAWGHHFLVAHNRHIFQEVVAARYLARNRALVVPTVVEQIPDYPLPATLFPVTQDPEFQLLTDVGVMTSAAGLTWYLADLFPPEYRNAVFVAEGAHNLVHVAAVRDHGATFRASRMFEDREFLASTDSWFRPVNFYLGPDGALYLIDYYRKVLEHPEWLDDATARSKDVSAGQDRGRIYRISPLQSPPPAWLDRAPLHGAGAGALVQALGHPNIWWRRHAQRLLVDRKPAAIARDLSGLAASGKTAAGRLHALWTLDGLGLIDSSHIERGLRDETAGVRENAIRLAELHLERFPALVDHLLRLTNDRDPKVRFQLLLTLGGLDTPRAQEARRRLLFEDVEDEWMQVAALSAARPDVTSLFKAAATQVSLAETPARRTLFTRLGALAAAESADRTGGSGAPSAARGKPANPHSIQAIVDEALADTSGAWWRAAALEGVATGLSTERRKGADLEANRIRIAQTLFRLDGAPVRRAALQVLEAIGLPAGATAATMVNEARRLAADSNTAAELRADAVSVLALDDPSRHEAALGTILERSGPAPVQTAAIRALAAPAGDRAASMFVSLWERWTPAVREEALRTFLREPARVRVLLGALEKKTIMPSEIDWPTRVRLMMTEDTALRTRARKLFGSTTTAPVATDAGAYGQAARLEGNVARGQQVFSRSCSMCHQYRGAGGIAFGPDLGELRGRLPRALLNDILHPNQSIADGYELWVGELTDGSTVSGIISAETPTSVTFRQAGGIETTIARVRLSSMRIAPMSAMPEGLASQIDVQGMADLIAFIRGGQ